MDLATDPDRYERLALDWLFAEITQLLRELKSAAVDDETRRVVAGNYLFGLTCRLDGSEGPGTTELCFADGPRVLRNGGALSLHDYVLGTVDQIIEDET